MPLSLLLHLPRGRADREAALATAALTPAHTKLTFTLRRVPTHVLPTAMRDTESDEALCAETTRGIDAATLRSLRWAVHKRHACDPKRVHRQLICDLIGGDESRVKRKPRRAR